MTERAALTPERLERALDILAGKIAAYGDLGRELLPVYQRLERELEAMRSEEDALAAVLRRAATRSSDQTGARSG